MKKILHENKQIVVISTYIIVLLIVLMNISHVYDTFIYILNILKPLWMAIAIAFVLNLPMKRIERLLGKVIKSDKRQGTRRTLAIVITLILAFIVLYLLFLIIIPKISSSITLLASNFGALVNNGINTINSFLKKLGADIDISKIDYVKSLENISWKDLLIGKADVFSGVIDNAMSFLNAFSNWFLGFCLSLYMLGSKEKLQRQLRKVVYAFFSDKHVELIMDFSKRANYVFTRFVGGQIVNCALLGVMCYVTYRLIDLPMPELNAAIVAVLSIIPVFGPMFSMVITFILTFAFNPGLAVVFIIVFQVVTNFESNIIYPKIVGSSIGLPGVWVLLSIFVLGSVFGIQGMILAVPVTALIYTMFAEFVNKRLQKKDMSLNDQRLDGVEN